MDKGRGSGELGALGMICGLAQVYSGEGRRL